MEFVKVTLDDNDRIEMLSALASAIVKEHYDPILGAEQNDYMIEKFQSVKGITEQLGHGYEYYLASEGESLVGFLGFYQRNEELYLSKLYLCKEHRGKGLSKKMLGFLVQKAGQMGLASIVLNVNKYNDSSIQAYKKLGFMKIGEEVNDIGHGYVMDDYVLEYKWGEVS